MVSTSSDTSTFPSISASMTGTIPTTFSPSTCDCDCKRLKFHIIYVIIIFLCLLSTIITAYVILLRVLRRQCVLQLPRETPPRQDSSADFGKVSVKEPRSVSVQTQAEFPERNVSMYDRPVRPRSLPLHLQPRVARPTSLLLNRINLNQEQIHNQQHDVIAEIHNETEPDSCAANREQTVEDYVEDLIAAAAREIAVNMKVPRFTAVNGKIQEEERVGSDEDPFMEYKPITLSRSTEHTSSPLIDSMNLPVQEETSFSADKETDSPARPTQTEDTFTDSSIHVRGQEERPQRSSQIRSASRDDLIQTSDREEGLPTTSRSFPFGLCQFLRQDAVAKFFDKNLDVESMPLLQRINLASREEPAVIQDEGSPAPASTSVVQRIPRASFDSLLTQGRRDNSPIESADGTSNSGSTVRSRPRPSSRTQETSLNRLSWPASFSPSVFSRSERSPRESAVANINVDEEIDAIFADLDGNTPSTPKSNETEL